MNRVLITTTSLQDTPGSHIDLLNQCGWQIDTARGPLSEAQMLELVGQYDGIICGDDVYTRAVLEKALPRLKILSKYGIGVDKIDVAAATALGIPVLYTPGVNHTTVAEHVFTLLLSLHRDLHSLVSSTRSGQWKRTTGHEIMGKTIGIVGLGRIGREVVIRARAFGMTAIAHDIYWPNEFAEEHQVGKRDNVEQLLAESDIVSLHCNLTEETRNLIDARRLSSMKDKSIIINCARGEVVDTDAVVDALNSGKLAGYGADVLDVEPPPHYHPLLVHEKAVITPHIASRTYESVVRQATKAITNLQLAFQGKQPLAQVNPEVKIGK